MITNLNHITLAVTDIDRSFTFYRDVLGLKPLVKWGKTNAGGGAYFLTSKGENAFWFCLDVNRNGVVTDSNLGNTHYAFSLSANDFESLSKRIIESGATVFKNNTSPGNSLYFFDPDGHKLEIHVGDWQTRIAAKKIDHGKWQHVEWFV
jgi:catechol 2,3-dioxygenase-like lactoylglutathione lyase family enzyme